MVLATSPRSISRSAVIFLHGERLPLFCAKWVSPFPPLPQTSLLHTNPSSSLFPQWPHNLRLHHNEKLRLHRTPSPTRRDPSLRYHHPALPLPPPLFFPTDALHSNLRPHLRRRRLLHPALRQRPPQHHGPRLHPPFHRPARHVPSPQFSGIPLDEMGNVLHHRAVRARFVLSMDP